MGPARTDGDAVYPFAGLLPNAPWKAQVSWKSGPSDQRCCTALNGAVAAKCGRSLPVSPSGINKGSPRLRRHFTPAIGGQSVDNENAHEDVGERPHRVEGHPPDGADRHDRPGEDPDPPAEL